MPNMVFASLINDVKTCVRTENLRDYDAIRSLIVLQECSHDARKGERAAVQSVGKLGGSVFIAIAQAEAVGLIGLEVGNGRNLKPAALGCRPEFEVISDGLGK